MSISGTENGGEIETICSSLTAAGYTVKFRGYSALDLYFRLPSLPFFWIETSADIAVLAHHIDNLRFPGVDVADAAVETTSGTCYFRCIESNEQSKASFPILSLTYDWRTKRFHDPLEVYTLLRELRDRKSETSPNRNIPQSQVENSRVVMEAALLLARYGFSAETFAVAKE